MKLDPKELNLLTQYQNLSALKGMNEVLEMVEAYRQKDPDSVSEVIEELKKHIDRKILLQREEKASRHREIQRTFR